MLEGETLLNDPYTLALSIVSTGSMRIELNRDFRTGFPYASRRSPRSARFRASRAVGDPEILRISNSLATHGTLAGTGHQTATVDRAEDGPLLTPTP